MKKIAKLLSLVIIVCIITLISVTQFYAETVFYADGFAYTQLHENYISICGWEGESDTVVIPQKLDGYFVKEIAGWAFSEKKSISSLEFGDADYLDTIGSMSFKECTDVTADLTIPPQIKKIGIGAFQGCNSFTTLYYNATASIPEQCFYSCSSLKTAVIDDGVKSIGTLAFADCSALEFIRIPESVTSIDQYAFENSTNVVLYCYKDSYVEQYAKDNGISYEIIDPLYGDANEDGDVNILDVTFIQKYKIGTKAFASAYGEKCADVNKSGDVTIRDATLIQMKIAKIIENF